MSLMLRPLKSEIEQEIGQKILAAHPLSGGSIAKVSRLEFADGRKFLLKTAQDGEKASFPLEARMLRYLKKKSPLPVPDVLGVQDHYLLLDYVENDASLSPSAERDAADHLAALHNVGAPSYGFECETIIATIPQPNVWCESWIDFFRDSRLLYMSHLCLEKGAIGSSLARRIERLAEDLEAYIGSPSPPGLIHGDLWHGNILAHEGRIAAFIDPAIYFADPEIELSFALLFGSLGEPFFARYQEQRPLRTGFFETRKEIYQLWHLLNHAYLFGQSYGRQVANILDRLGIPPSA